MEYENELREKFIFLGQDEENGTTLDPEPSTSDEDSDEVIKPGGEIPKEK
ncbi:hypothetical protein [uncultured Aquimarina sp.]|nr:hypothetical protein [uncultured Aquimarina sp.]